MLRNRKSVLLNKPWWLAGGIRRQNCLAAYQPVGSSDYASSKINLANPGVYNSVDGAAYPTWDSINGWYFTTNRYLTTGIVPNGGNYSAIVRFTGAVTSAANRIFGSETGSAPRFFIIPNYNTDHYYANGPSVNGGEAITAGVMAIAGTGGYLNGVLDMSVAAWSGTLTYDIYIGAENDDGVAARFIVAYIQAIAFYNIVLTDSQIMLLTNAINQL